MDKIKNWTKQPKATKGTDKGRKHKKDHKEEMSQGQDDK